jgi:hypothetical protein
MTRLIELRLTPELEGGDQHSLTASMLSGACHLTRPELLDFSIEPGALARKTRLQHLNLCHCQLAEGAAGVTQLLSHLQPMQQLTQLHLARSLQAVSTCTTDFCNSCVIQPQQQLTQHLQLAASCNS